ncbi:RISC-loading complex subunit TARBP2 isoform X1 [Plutella xylostella]|uniref:RISC-loading complex subunit TARBP2 isoform X1 n=1 Tax=Plutella xylostella TaxID=51655 RepID=UPI002032D0DE|nr:RISC-loading complex subunit TARBP2 isoform X1 [Plutella xylostella]
MAESMKTPVTLLQELMVRLGETPVYDCVAQMGPAHSSLFEYRCSAHGASATAVARSKREAKQEAARGVLARLAAAGVAVPGAPPAPAAAPAPAPAPPPRTHVALLKELCEEYRLAAPDYELVSDTGPAHLRHFTMRARVGRLARAATATTKKQARQLAAEALYSYLRDHSARLTSDFVEEEALARAHEKAMERYQEAAAAWRPDLGQRVADYPAGLATHAEIICAVAEPEQQAAARAVLAERAGAAAGEGDEERLARAVDALGLALEWDTLHTHSDQVLHVVSTSRGAPPLAQWGASRAGAAARLLDTLQLALRPRPAHTLPAT